MSFAGEKDWAINRLSQGRGGREPFLTRSERDAAERLRSDFTRGSLMASVSQSWDFQPAAKAGRGAAGDLSDTAIDARARVEGAIDAIGPELAGLILDIACHLKGLEEVERTRGWPARSAKMLLKVGLGMLVRHYGLDGVDRRGCGPLRGWKAPDARPSIAPV
ncbi:DUF6456 domain-containing protein [Fulvimarina sp. 2208YS6-2-32]|uniref:DUF6456 domain-containing protein n=1 Tax=Fulvimarina uroteuthidis TaxID=3098149 RepID=A0ABU5I3M4_9HYPH|nr:DUF6456 domain-containing protein [Fulvimarina sp. 2208YS6-2-32]MDY8109982.1 DUF6456 domain-containing protein [Fulvimarina sp. 2208YS6-2-32]